MKRSKILIPTLSALAVSPAIVLSSCNQTKPEQTILDAIFNPLDLAQKPIDDFATEYDKLTFDEKRQELIFDAFGLFNWDIGNGENKVNVRALSKDNKGAFKINVTKCDVKKVDSTYKATLLGYVTYVFSEEHTVQYYDKMTFKADDYMMLTFDFVDAPIKLEDFGFFIQPQYGLTLGFWKFKFNGGQNESLVDLDQINTYIPKWTVHNSHNWVQK